MLDTLPWAGGGGGVPHPWEGALMTGTSAGGEPATPEPSYSLTPFVAGWHGEEMRLTGYVVIRCPWKAPEGLGYPVSLYGG